MSSQPIREGFAKSSCWRGPRAEWHPTVLRLGARTWGGQSVWLTGMEGFRGVSYGDFLRASAVWGGMCAMLGPPRGLHALLQSSSLSPPPPSAALSLAPTPIITISTGQALYYLPGTVPNPSHALSSHNSPLRRKPA